MAGRGEIMLIIGIDPSLTATGIVVLRDGKVELAETTKNRPELGTIERVRLIRERIIDITENLINEEKTEWQAPDLIVIEGFSYGSKGRSLFDIAYLGWRIREDLEQLKVDGGVPWIEPAPDSVKKFASNKGTSTKDVMIKEVYKRWGFDTDSDDLADAYVLAQIGRAYLGDTEGLTAFQQEVITNLKGEKPKKKPRKKVEK
jgi:crossover junction endodeoxyribonuclease RuvC